MAAPELPLPEDLFADGRRHLVLLAHHDDEVPYAGLLQRMGPDVRVVWLTNSDGLSYLDGEDPEAYARRRFSESVAAMSILGIGLERMGCHEHSEIALYDLFGRMVRGHVRGVPSRFLMMADPIEAEVRAFEPDVVWTLAYQAGNPEHDLVHLYAARAVRRLAAETGRALPLFELPAYELTFVAMRFPPWRKEPVHAIELTDEELALKERLLPCFPSQWRIISGFRKVIGLYGAFTAHRALFRGAPPISEASFARREVFAPVPRDRDYTLSPHAPLSRWLPQLDYPGDDFLGTPIRFAKTLAPIAEALGLGPGG